MTIRLRACRAPSSGQWRFCERRPVSASWKRLAPPTTLAAKDWSAIPASGIAAVRSGDTGGDCPYRYLNAPGLAKMVSCESRRRLRGRKREQRRSLRRRYDHPRPNAIDARRFRRLAHGLPSQLRPDSFKFDPNRIRVDDGCDSTSGENRIVGVRSVSHGERSCGGCVIVAYDVRHRCLLPGFERVPPNPLAQPDSAYRLPPLSIWWRRPLT